MPERPSQNPEHLIATQSQINDPPQPNPELDNSNEKFDDDKAPEGWLTPRSLQRLGIVSEYIAKRESEKYKAEHPEWIKLYKTPRGQGPFEHYSPELIEEIRKSLNQYEYAPDNWLTIRSLCHLLGRSRDLVEREIEKYKAEHPEWVKKYKNSDNRVLEHISPELIEIIRSELTPESVPHMDGKLLGSWNIKQKVILF